MGARPVCPLAFFRKIDTDRTTHLRHIKQAFLAWPQLFAQPVDFHRWTPQIPEVPAMGLARKLVVRGINCLAVASPAAGGWRAVGFAREYLVVTDQLATEDDAYRSWEQKAFDSLQFLSLGSLFAGHSRNSSPA
jgi:hypothetical protein